MLSVSFNYVPPSPLSSPSPPSSSSPKIYRFCGFVNFPFFPNLKPLLDGRGASICPGPSHTTLHSDPTCPGQTLPETHGVITQSQYRNYLTSYSRFRPDWGQKHIFQNNLVFGWVNKCVTDVYSKSTLSSQRINTVSGRLVVSNFNGRQGNVFL